MQCVKIVTQSVRGIFLSGDWMRREKNIGIRLKFDFRRRVGFLMQVKLKRVGERTES